MSSYGYLASVLPNPQSILISPPLVLALRSHGLPLLEHKNIAARYVRV